MNPSEHGRNTNGLGNHLLIHYNNAAIIQQTDMPHWFEHINAHNPHIASFFMLSIYIFDV